MTRNGIDDFSFLRSLIHYKNFVDPFDNKVARRFVTFNYMWVTIILDLNSTGFECFSRLDKTSI